VADAYYAVQVLTVENTPARVRSLEEDMDFLRRMGITDLVKAVNRSNTKVTLFAGSFTREQKGAADQLARRIRLMVVPGKADEFKDAQVMPKPAQSQ
jgi:hypothetical protein